jgi:PAS domain S-box-containing protein
MGRSNVPVTVKNADGYYIFANSAAEQLLGYRAGHLGGKHIEEITADDPIWLRSEFERFKADQVWFGSLRFHSENGQLVTACLNAFVAVTQSGAGVYASLLRRSSEPARHHSPVDSQESRRAQGLLTVEDRRMLQLLAEGFSDRDVASILGLTEWAATREVLILMQKMRVRSRTEACLKALKAHAIA